ncbi:MAG: hypothetical protein ACRDHY_01860 [Anaerolineales bacterium]
MARGAFLGAGLASALLVASVLPTSAPAAQDSDDPWVVWAASDGTHGVNRLSELARDHGGQDWHQVGFEHCYLLAPLEDACTLHGNSTLPAPGGTWLTGWFPPTIRRGISPLPFENGGFGQGGALVASTDLEMTGTTNTAKVIGRCTWAAAAYRGDYLPPGVPPAVVCEFEFIEGGGRYPSGLLTANFRAGIYDPSMDPDLGSMFPSTEGMDGGVGTMHGVLFAR